VGRARLDHDHEPTLRPEEERDLAWRIEAGVLAGAARLSGIGVAGASVTELLLIEDEGIRARHRFISANLPLVSLVLRELAPRNRFPEPDLFQEGCLGLAVAVMRFDYRRGIRFATYGLYWIRAYVGAATAGQLGALNLPTDRAEQLRMARYRQTELAQNLGRLPTTAELASALGRDERWTSELVSYQRPRSLDALDPDLVTDSAEQITIERRSFDGQGVGADLLCRLDDLGRRVLEYRFGFADGEPHSYADTARLLGMTASRARRLEHKALDQLRRICPQSASAQLW
jgi:RNA polymerase sigma factor (sigma-70 family)